MKRALLMAALALSACAEADKEADPRCADLLSTWSCPQNYGTARARCIDGEYEEETCSAETWCLVTRPDAQSPYEGTCAPRAWRAGGCDTGSTVCDDGWICWRNGCYRDCAPGRELCNIEGETCRGDLKPLSSRPLCTTAEDRQ
jgi:hypothetical protein